MSDNHQRQRQTALADALAGVTGTVISLWAFYPLEVVKTNLQASIQDRVGDNKNKKGQQIPHQRPYLHDISSLLRIVQSMFRGCCTKTLHATSSSFCYFYLYSFILSTYYRQRQQRTLLLQKPSKSSTSTHMYPSTRLFLSAVAAMLNTFITLPLDVISSQCAIQGTNVTSKHNIPWGTSANEKMNLVWNQLKTSTTLSPSSSSSSSSSNNDYEDAVFQEPLSNKPSASSSMQLDAVDDVSSKDLNGPDRPMNTDDILRESLEVIDIDNNDTRDNKLLWNKTRPSSTSSLAYLWKGLTPALMLCLNPAIHYTVYDVFKNQLLSSWPRATPQSPDQVTNHYNQNNRRLSMTQSFLLGVMAKFVATIATYPLIRAKVILMVTSETSLWSALVKSYQNDNGIWGLYKGCDWQLLHTLLKNALMMMVREQITEQTHRWIVGGEEQAGAIQRKVH
jgi:hypothetical protein